MALVREARRILGAALVLCLALACSREEPWILFTSSLSGYLEACTCPGTPQGGLNAAATLIKEFRKEHPGALLVDPGCFSSESLNAWYIARAMRLVGYDAVALGRCERGRNYDLDDLPLLGLSKPWVLKRGVLIAWADTAPEAVRKLLRNAPKARYTVLLSSSGFPHDSALARALRPTAILEAKGEGHFRVGKTIVFGVKPRGMEVGAVNLATGEVKILKVKKSTPLDSAVNFVLNAFLEAYKRELSSGELIRFRGAGFCRFCHKREYEAWRESKHARAFETLKEEGKEENPFCLKCHSTGYGRGGFVNEEETPQLAGVSCEECHPGGRCPSSPPPKPSLDDCRRCHTPEQSPDFEPQKYWREIEH